MAAEDTELYCICQKPYDGTSFMIFCDQCNGWFHGSCVGVTEDQAALIDTYHCDDCTRKHGPLILKPRRTVQHQNYADLHDGRAKSIDDRLVFINQLQSRTFLNCSEVVHCLCGEEVRHTWLEGHQFNSPILVKDKKGLGLRVPPPSFTVVDVEAHVGSMRRVTVMDVSTQAELREEFVMRSWCQYYNKPPERRTRVLNVISLEFSDTPLSDFIVAPTVVRQVDWIDKYWPAGLDRRPKIQKYCLMGTKGSYTDFHLDFGGTSVWYHVLRGKKVFYLIPPTGENFELFRKWNASPGQNEIFFGDVVTQCYECPVLPGQTFFIPSGWIHAVLTPEDSLVFGGNFLHRYSIAMQLKVYQMERTFKTADRFRVPSFEMLHWFAASFMLEELRRKRERREAIAPYFHNGLKYLVESLQSWITVEDSPFHRNQIPSTVAALELVDDLGQELKLASVPTRAAVADVEHPLKLRISTKVVNGQTVDKPEPVKLKLSKGRIVTPMSTDTRVGSNARWQPKAELSHDFTSGISTGALVGLSDDSSSGSDVDVLEEDSFLPDISIDSDRDSPLHYIRDPLYNHSDVDELDDNHGCAVKTKRGHFQALPPGDSSWHPGTRLDKPGRHRTPSGAKALAKKRKRSETDVSSQSVSTRNEKTAVPQTVARKRVKKGSATAKQRLGKKLGMNKMAYF